MHARIDEQLRHVFVGRSHDDVEFVGHQKRHRPADVVRFPPNGIPNRPANQAESVQELLKLLIVARWPLRSALFVGRE